MHFENTYWELGGEISSVFIIWKVSKVTIKNLSPIFLKLERRTINAICNMATINKEQKDCPGCIWFWRGKTRVHLRFSRFLHSMLWQSIEDPIYAQWQPNGWGKDTRRIGLWGEPHWDPRASHWELNLKVVKPWDWVLGRPCTVTFLLKHLGRWEQVSCLHSTSYTLNTLWQSFWNNPDCS